MANEIAFRMGYLCKRVITFDLEMQKQKTFTQSRKRSRSPDHERPHNVTSSSSSLKEKDSNSSSSSYYWDRKTVDIAQLSDALAKRDREYYALFELNSKLVASYKELERKVNSAERELNFLRSDPYRGLEPFHSGSVVFTVPVSTQGKDAFYWHGVCRRMETQYLQAKDDADEKARQLVFFSNRIKELESMMAK